MATTETLCGFCGKPATPGAPGVAYVVLGFEYQRKGGGANAIHLRKRIGPVAHEECVEAAKPRQRERLRFEEPALDLSKIYGVGDGD